MDEPISDAQLRSQLKARGFDAGPITDSTRSVYLKKLKNLIAESNTPSKIKGNRKSVSKVTVPTSVSEKDYTNTIAATNTDSPMKTRRRSLPRDSVSSTLSNSRLPSVPKSPVMSPARLSQPVKTTPAASNATEHSLGSRASGAFSQSVNKENTPQRGAGHTPTRTTYVYYRNGASSDSDVEEAVESSNPLSNTMSRVAGWLRRSSHLSGVSAHCEPMTSSDSSQYRIPRTQHVPARTSEDDRLYVSDSDYSDSENRWKGRFSFVGSREPRRDTGTATSTSLLFTPPRLMEKSGTTPSRHAVSILSDDSPSDLRFRSTSAKFKSDRSQTRNSFGRLSETVAHIPNMILLGGMVILSLLGLSYLLLRGHHGQVGKMAALQRIVCDPGVSDPGCLQQTQLTEALPLVSDLCDILSRYAGEFHCATSSVQSPKMSVRVAQGLAERKWLLSHSQVADFASVWKAALFIILHVDKAHFHVAAYDAFGMELGPTSLVSAVAELESLNPYFSGLCRIGRGFSWFLHMLVKLFWLVTALSLVAGMGYGVWWFRAARLRKAEQAQARIRDLVAEIIRMLQQQLRENEADPTQPPYVPVRVLRDRLLQQHPDAYSLWSKIVRYVHDVETCIEVRDWRRIGETWQWQGGTGWQGSALLDHSQKPAFVIPPTECLKIRNMFSAEYLDTRVKERIKRELLKKLSNCGPILHIGLDTVGTKGLVYVKCANPDTAGRIYHAIHANYFDGRLLMVKFLRDTKYCLRFPEAHGLTQPLSVANSE